MKCPTFLKGPMSPEGLGPCPGQDPSQEETPIFFVSLPDPREGGLTPALKRPHTVPGPWLDTRTWSPFHRQGSGVSRE